MAFVVVGEYEYHGAPPLISLSIMRLFMFAALADTDISTIETRINKILFIVITFLYLFALDFSNPFSEA